MEPKTDHSEFRDNKVLNPNGWKEHLKAFIPPKLLKVIGRVMLGATLLGGGAVSASRIIEHVRPGLTHASHSEKVVFDKLAEENYAEAWKIFALYLIDEGENVDPAVISEVFVQLATQTPDEEIVKPQISREIISVMQLLAQFPKFQALLTEGYTTFALDMWIASNEGSAINPGEPRIAGHILLNKENVHFMGIPDTEQYMRTGSPDQIVEAGFFVKQLELNWDKPEIRDLKVTELLEFVIPHGNVYFLPGSIVRVSRDEHVETYYSYKMTTWNFQVMVTGTEQNPMGIKTLFLVVRETVNGVELTLDATTTDGQHFTAVAPGQSNPMIDRANALFSQATPVTPNSNQ